MKKSLNILYIVSLFPNTLLILVALLIFSFGACYNGCNSLADYWFVILVMPFCVPLYISLAALRRWRQGGGLKKSHPIVLGIYGGFLIGFGVYASITDSPDSIFYIPIALLGVMVAMPAIYALVARPDFS